jgi:methylthioribose-1-phosphate isomerase
VLEVVAFDGEVIRLLDQRALPQYSNYLNLKTPQDVTSAIQNMAVRGAPMIGVLAAFGMALALEKIEDPKSMKAAFRAAKELIQASRPTAKNLFYALRVMEDAFNDSLNKDIGPKDIRKNLKIRASSLFKEEAARSKAISKHGASLIPHKARVLTHCNTGSLAAPGPGTALGAIKEAFSQGRIEEVFVDETRPLLQGSRLTAFELDSEGIPYRILVDGAAASLLEAKRVDMVLVGSDRIAANGDTANKVGTLMLARLCAVHGVPFIVLAPTSTIDPNTESGLTIPIEERNEDEVLTLANKRIAPSMARAFNPAFDITPAGLIHAIVTEQGIVSAPYSFKGSP